MSTKVSTKDQRIFCLEQLAQACALLDRTSYLLNGAHHGELARRAAELALAADLAAKALALKITRPSYIVFAVILLAATGGDCLAFADLSESWEIARRSANRPPSLRSPIVFMVPYPAIP